MKKTLAALVAALPLAALAQAAPEAAHGLWLSAQKDGVVQLAPCNEEPSALCGTVVWDKDAKAVPPVPGDCGLRILKLRHFEDGAWRDGWIHDPREKKNYKGLVRAQGRDMTMRAYIGVQVLGKSEEFTKVDSVPAGCPAKG